MLDVFNGQCELRQIGIVKDSFWKLTINCQNAPFNAPFCITSMTAFGKHCWFQCVPCRCTRVWTLTASSNDHQHLGARFDMGTIRCYRRATIQYTFIFGTRDSIPIKYVFISVNYRLLVWIVLPSWGLSVKHSWLSLSVINSTVIHSCNEYWFVWLPSRWMIASFELHKQNHERATWDLWAFDLMRRHRIQVVAESKTFSA